jgi:hypothetical protein
MNYRISFSLATIKLALRVIKKRKSETLSAYKLLADIEEKENGEFNPKTKRKVAVSYGIYLPLICDSFTLLHGRYANDEEKKRFIHYFIFCSLFDDFTDDTTMTDADLRAISYHPETYTAKNFDEKVFIQSNSFLKNIVTQKESYDKLSKAAFDAQIESRRQEQPDLGRGDLQRITFHKGGYCVQLSHHYLLYRQNDDEEKIWYLLGILIQLTNDLYDIHKDLQQPIFTLPNTLTDIYSFEKNFHRIIDNIRRSISELKYEKKLLSEFNHAVAGIFSFGLIAIDQLKKIQGSAGSMPDLNTIPRKELIVDMEKLFNIRKWLMYSYKYSKLYSAERKEFIAADLEKAEL